MLLTDAAATAAAAVVRRILYFFSPSSCCLLKRHFPSSFPPFQPPRRRAQSCEQSVAGDVTPAWWGHGSGQRSKALAEARLAQALDSLRTHFASAERQLDKCSGLTEKEASAGEHATSAPHALRVALDSARSQLLAARRPALF